MRLLDLLVLAVLLLPSCTTTPRPGFLLTPPDALVCTDLGTRGWCRLTVSQKSFYVDNDKLTYLDPLTNKERSWSELKRYAVIMPAASWVKLKNFVDNVCHQVNCANGSGSWDGVVNDILNHIPPQGLTE